MALELARAFISVQVDKAKLRSEIAMARKEIIKGLSGIKVKVQVDAEAFAKSAAAAGKKAGAAAGKAAQQEANRYFGGFKVPPNAGSGFNVTGGLIRRPPLGPINVQQPGPRGLLGGPSPTVAHGPVTARRIGGPVGDAGYQRRLGQTFVGGGGGPTYHHGGVPWGASARVTPIGPGQLLIDGPTGPEGYQKRLGHTFNMGSGGPTFGQGGVPHGTGRGPRNPPPPSDPYGPFPTQQQRANAPFWRIQQLQRQQGHRGTGGIGRGFGGGGRGGWLGMGGGRGYGGLMGGGVGSFLGGAGFAVAPMLTGISTFGGPAGTAGYLGARAVGASLGEFGDYEQSIRRAQVVQQNNGAGPDQLARMDAQARELGRTTVFSAQEAADAMVVLSQKGFDANEVYKQMPAILNLAAAGQIEISEAADIAASTMRQFGLEASDTTKIADVMTTAFLKSSAEVKDIGVALRYVGPMAKQAGYSLEQTVAGIMMLRNAGLTPSMAGTGLARLLGHMADPKKLEALAGAGINVDNGSGGFRDLTDIIGQAGAAISKMSELQAVGFSKDVFGFRGGPAFGALVQQGQSEAEQNLAELENATGASAKVAAHELENFNSQLKLLEDALSDLGISLGELAAIPATSAMNETRSVLEDISAWLRTVKQVWGENGAGNPAMNLPTFQQQEMAKSHLGPASQKPRSANEGIIANLLNTSGVYRAGKWLGGALGFERGKILDDVRAFNRGGQNPEAEAESEKAFQEVLRLRKARKNRPLEEQNRRDAAGAALRNAAQQAINNRVFAPVVGTKALGRAGRLAAGAGMRGVLGGASGRGWRGAEWAQNALGTEVAPGGTPGAPDALLDLPAAEPQLMHEDRVDAFAASLSQQMESQQALIKSTRARALAGGPDARKYREQLTGLRANEITPEEYQRRISEFEEKDKRESGLSKNRNFDSRSFGLEGMHSSIQQGVLRRREDETLKVQQSIEKGVNTTATNTGNLISAIKELNPGFA